jgi:hypothetical protein
MSCFRVAALCTLVLFATFLGGGREAFAQEAMNQAENPDGDNPGQSVEEPLADGPPAQETALITDRPGPPIEISWETAIVGGDYDSGQTNGMLQDIGYRECRVICMLDDRCKAYTHDGQANTCYLKDSTGEKTYASNAISGVFVDKKVVPETRIVRRNWVITEYDPNLTWHSDDTAATYISRIRAASKPFATSCEWDKLQLSDINIQASIASEGTVGESIEFHWSGNDMRAVVPVWLMVSTPSKARFSGKGFYALNAGAHGPFGIDVARDRTRAFVALYNHSAGRGGSFGIMPQTAGKLDLDVRVVAYLRGCDETVQLSQQAFSIAVKPAEPHIVLHDPYALNIYGQQADIAAFGRKVLFNDSRFLILESELGSEILERNGTDIRFSPTGRYISVRNDNESDVIDVVDGTVVARIGDNMSGPDLQWFYNDSFVAVTRPPWGRAWLASTLNVGKPIYHPEISAACCDFDPSSGIMDISLENNVVRIADGVGGVAANLQDFELAADYPTTNGYDETFNASSAIFLDAMGPVLPLPNRVGINQPYPTASGAVSIGDAEVKVASAEPASDDTLEKTRGAVSLIKPADYLKDRRIDLATFGFELAPEKRATSILDPAEIPDWAGEFYEEAEKKRAAIRRELSKQFSAKGIRVDWMIPTGDFERDLYCDYLKGGAEAKPSELPGALTLAQRLDRPDGAVWILRSQCQGGGTSATQAYKSSLMIIDESRGAGQPAHQSIVEELSTDGTVFDAAFYDADFQTKLIDGKRIIFYMPKRGAIGLFDLERREFVYKQQNLPRGDLLADAHIRSDGKFVLQVNSDKSFSVDRIADARALVEGRQVDGETVFWAPDFRFDSTAEGASFVELRFPGMNGQYTFQQFDTRLRRTGLLEAALKDDLEPSSLAIHVPPRLGARLNGNGDRITGEATPTGGSAISEIRLYQDGVLTNTFPATASGQAVTIDAARLPGARWVSLVAADAEGLVSLPIGRDLGADRALTKTSLLAIGIDEYHDERLPDLGLATSDARNLSAAMLSLNGKSIDLDRGSDTVLTDAKASRTAILDAAKRMVAETGPGDNAVIFFAGHGLQDKSGRLYLGLTDTAVSRIEDTALAWEDLAAILTTAKGRVTVLLDACHSGTAGTGFLSSNDDAVNAIRRTIPSGLTVLAASKGRELSAEMRNLGGGVFTYSLVEALVSKRKAADADGNGRIEVSELYRYVKDRVVGLRKGEQTPWLARNQMIGDFALF